jgi:galactonate dehydratase
VKYDIDERNDPAKYDAYNWTASPGELERMYNQIAAVREAVGPRSTSAWTCTAATT